MWYKAAGTSLISVPKITTAKAVDIDKKYLIEFTLEDGSAETWTFQSAALRDKELQYIFDLQIAYRSIKTSQ